MSLGSELRKRRRELDLTLKDLSTKSGYNTSHISGIEHDRVMPSLKAYVNICSALNVEPGKYLEYLKEELK